MIRCVSSHPVTNRHVITDSTLRRNLDTLSDHKRMSIQSTETPALIETADDSAFLPIPHEQSGESEDRSQMLYESRRYISRRRA